MRAPVQVGFSADLHTERAHKRLLYGAVHQKARTAGGGNLERDHPERTVEVPCRQTRHAKDVLDRRDFLHDPSGLNHQPGNARRRAAEPYSKAAH